MLVEGLADINLEDQDAVFDPSPEQIAASLRKSVNVSQKHQADSAPKD